LKLIYYSYHLKFKSNNYLQDARKAFETYSNNSVLQGKILTALGEPLYLFTTTMKNLYLFVMVRDDEMVKAIDKKQLSQTDIQNRLTQDESLGFASYVFIGDCFYAIASTFFGPKNGIWQEFATNLIQELCKQSGSPMEIVFGSEPFPTSITRQEAQKDVKFFGSTSIKINDNSSMMARFKALFGGATDVGSVEIIIRPPARKFFSGTKDGILNTFNSNIGVDRFIIKGKRDAGDSLTDLYVVGSGHISDNVSGKNENQVIKQIINKVHANDSLKDALGGLKNDKRFKRSKVPGLPNIF